MSTEAHQRLAAPPFSAPGKTHSFRMAGVPSFMRRYPGFVFFVLLPSILAILYYGFLESNIYTSSAQFLIKEANENSSLTGLGTFLQSTGISTTPNDAYTVDAYLSSRDATRLLESNAGLRTVYSRPNGDFINRFPNLVFGPSFENLYNHFNNWMRVDFNSSSNITTLSVDAFSPGDAHAVAERLLRLGEADVNRLNDRVRNDALRGAKREVATLQSRLTEVQAEVTSFRGRERMLNPDESSTQSVLLLSTLESDMVTARAALDQQQRSAPHSPALPGLRARVNALEGQIASEAVKGAGQSGSLAPKLSQYQQILLRQQFLQQMLQAAVTSLESAEATVQQQQLYLARVAEPSTPDMPYNTPIYRITIIGVVMFTCLILYWIGRMLAAVIRDHLQ